MKGSIAVIFLLLVAACILHANDVENELSSAQRAYFKRLFMRNLQKNHGMRELPESLRGNMHERIVTTPKLSIDGDADDVAIDEVEYLPHSDNSLLSNGDNSQDKTQPINSFFDQLPIKADINDYILNHQGNNKNGLEAGNMNPHPYSTTEFSTTTKNSNSNSIASSTTRSTTKTPDSNSKITLPDLNEMETTDSSSTSTVQSNMNLFITTADSGMSEQTTASMELEAANSATFYPEIIKEPAYLSSTWAETILNERFPSLIGANLHGGATDSENGINTREEIVRARDFLMLQLIQEMKVEEQLVCAVAEEITGILRFVLRSFHLSTAKTELSDIISHSAIHSQASDQCLQNIAEGSVTDDLYLELFAPLEWMMQATENQGEFDFNTAMDLYTEKMSSYLLEQRALHYTADQVTLALFTFSRDLLMIWKQRLVLNTKSECRERASDIQETVAFAYTSLYDAHSTRAALTKALSNGDLQDCASIIENVRDALWEHEDFFVSTESTLQQTLTLFDKLLANSMLQKPVIHSALGLLLDTIYTPAAGEPHLMNIQGEIYNQVVAAVSVEDHVELSTPIQETRLDSISWTLHQVSLGVYYFLRDDCFLAKTLAVLIGLVETDHLSLQARTNQDIVALSHDLHTQLTAEHPEVGSQFRRIIQRRLQSVIRKHYKKLVEDLVSGLEQLTGDVMTETLALDIDHLVASHVQDGDMTTLGDLVKHVIETVVLGYSQSYCPSVTLSDKALITDATELLDTFMNSAMSGTYVSDETVISIVSSANVPGYTISSQAVTKMHTSVVTALERSAFAVLSPLDELRTSLTDASSGTALESLTLYIYSKFSLLLYKSSHVTTNDQSLPATTTPEKTTITVPCVDINPDTVAALGNLQKTLSAEPHALMWFMMGYIQDLWKLLNTISGQRGGANEQVQGANLNQAQWNSNFVGDLLKVCEVMPEVCAKGQMGGASDTGLGSSSSTFTEGGSSSQGGAYSSASAWSSSSASSSSSKSQSWRSIEHAKAKTRAKHREQKRSFLP